MWFLDKLTIIIMSIALALHYTNMPAMIVLFAVVIAVNVGVIIAKLALREE